MEKSIIPAEEKAEDETTAQTESVQNSTQADTKTSQKETKTTQTE